MDANERKTSENKRDMSGIDECLRVFLKWWKETKVATLICIKLPDDLKIDQITI